MQNLQSRKQAKKRTFTLLYIKRRTAQTCSAVYISVVHLFYFCFGSCPTFPNANILNLTFAECSSDPSITHYFCVNVTFLYFIYPLMNIMCAGGCNNVLKHFSIIQSRSKVNIYMGFEGEKRSSAFTYHPPHAALVLLPLAGHLGALFWCQLKTPKESNRQQNEESNVDAYKAPPASPLPLHQTYWSAGMTNGGVETRGATQRETRAALPEGCIRVGQPAERMVGSVM